MRRGKNATNRIKYTNKQQSQTNDTKPHSHIHTNITRITHTIVKTATTSTTSNDQQATTNKQHIKDVENDHEKSKGTDSKSN